MFDTKTLAVRYGEPDFTALQARADALIHFINSPLPAGDAGLLAAEQRLRDLDAKVARFFPADLPFAVAQKIRSRTSPI